MSEMLASRPALSDSDAPRLLTDSTGSTSALSALVASARLELCLLSRCLDCRSYGGAAVTEIFKGFLLGSERARLRVLVADPRRAAAQRGLPLLELGRRLSSRVEFRDLPARQAASLTDVEWVIADGCTLLELSLRALEPSRYWPQATTRARLRRNAFAEMWEQSTPSMSLRALSL